MNPEPKFCPHEFKANFPIYSQEENRRLIYLDNAATTQKPQCVLASIYDFYLTKNGNAHRANHRLSRHATDCLEYTRQQAAKFLGAASNEIIFCRGATEGINIIAQGLSYSLNPGDEIIISEAEHHANFLPWQRLAEIRNLQLIKLPIKNGAPDLNKLPQLITDSTRLIALTAASNVLGVSTDLHRLSKCVTHIKQTCQALVIVDAAQIAAHTCIDVKLANIDFLVCSGHKIFGPNGVGLLYGRSQVLQTLSPMQLGGEMVDQVTWEYANYAKPPRRFEAGTLPLAAIAGLGAAMTFLSAQNRQGIQKHEHQLVEYLHNGLSSLPDLKLLTTPVDNIGIATFTFASNKHLDKNQQDLALWLDGHDIAVRVGRHCAHALYECLGAPMGAIRVSVAPYNLKSDIESFLNSVSDWLTMVRKQRSPVTRRDGEQLNQNQPKQDSLAHLSINDLKLQHQWQKRYGLLMQWGDAIIAKPHLRQSRYLVAACEANTWLKHFISDGKHYFAFDSESRIIRGLGALLLLWFNGLDHQAIQTLDWQTQAQDLGLSNHLSQSRRNGFYALAHAMLESVNDSTPL